MVNSITQKILDARDALKKLRDGEPFNLTIKDWARNCREGAKVTSKIITGRLLGKREKKRRKIM